MEAKAESKGGGKSQGIMAKIEVTLGYGFCTLTLAIWGLITLCGGNLSGLW
jgi:hypothetical protein